MLKLVENQEPVVSNFTASRTKHNLTIYYKDAFFYSITCSYELNNEEIKKALRSALWIKYFSSMDIKDILNGLGEYYRGDDFNKDII